MDVDEHTRIHNAKNVQEFYLKHISLLYDKAGSYTNLVLIGGYGAFFALLAATRTLLPGGHVRWAACLMLISVSTYIGFEVTKMVITTRKLLANWKTFRQEETTLDANVINARFQELENKELRQNAWFIPLWVICVWVAVVTAILAVGILLWNFVVGLL